MSPSGFTLVCPFCNLHKYFQTLVHPLIDGFKQTLTSTFHLWLKIMIQCASFMERHCAAIAVIWKLHGNNSGVSSAQIFSSTTCISDSSTHPTQFSRPCWYSTKGGTMIWQILREQREGSQGIIVPCFHHTTSGSRLVLLVHDWFYTWAGRFRWSWVVFLSKKQRWPKNTQSFEFFITSLQP
jgi:hypothetical protein